MLQALAAKDESCLGRPCTIRSQHDRSISLWLYGQFVSWFATQSSRTSSPERYLHRTNPISWG